MDSDEQHKGLDVPHAPEACRRLLEAVGRGGIGLALTDATDRFVYVNDTHSRIYGHSREETLGKTWRDFVPPETVPAHEEAGRRAFERGEVYHSEAPGIRADGTTGRYEVADVPLAGPGQPYTGHVCIIRDVTERRRAEEALRESEERFRDLVENSEDIIWSIDERGHITYVNPAVERVLDIPAVEITGRHFSEFLAPSHRAETTALFEQVLSGRQLRQELATLSKPTGGVAYLSVNAKAMRAPDGRVLGAWGTARDITEARRAEEALRESEERYRDLVENSGDIIWSVDAQGRFTYINPAVKPIMELATSEVIGHRFAEFLAPGEEEKAAALFREVLAGETLPPQELTFRKPSGELVHLSVSARAVRNGRGRIVGVQGTARDVTEKVRAEEKLALYRDIIANSSEAITILDLKGSYVEQNAAHAALLGHSDEELLGRTPALHVGEEAFVRMLEAVTATGRYRGEVRARAKDGRSLTLDLSVFVVRDSAGRPVCYVGMKRDVTERVRAEEELARYRLHLEELVEERTGELRESEERLKLAQSAADVGTWDWDIESNRATCSERYYRQYGLGLDHEPISLEDWLQAVHPEDRERAAARAKEALENKVPYENEYRVVWSDGSVHWLVSKAQVFFNEAGQPRRMIGASIDITERKRAEEALREERNFSSAVLDTVGALVVVLDREGRIVRFNQACEQVTGYAFEEVEGRPFWEFLLIPEEVEPVKEVFSRLRAGQFPVDHENYWVTKDGGRRRIAWSNTVLSDEGGEVSYLIGTGIDITERRRAEEESRSLARFPGENPNPVLRVAQDLTVLYANEASRPVLETWRLEVGQTIPEAWRERVARAFRTGVSEQTEVECGQRTFAFTFTPIGTDYVNLYGLDITERVRAERALRQSEQRYHALFANNHAVMLLIEPETGRIVDANPAAWLFYGYTREELTAKQIQEINTLSPEEVLAEMHRAKTWERNLFIFRHRLADGQVRDVEVYSGPIHVAGKPLLYSIVHDITERVRAERALAGQTGLLEAVFEGSHAMLVYLDRDFNFVRVNEAYAQACARSKEELLGRNHFELYPQEANQAIFERVRDTGEPYNAVARPFTFPDYPEWGETYWDWRLTPVKGGNDAGGRVEGFVFSLFDVTERVRRLQELELARRRIEVLARREEERASWLATILDQLPVGVVIASAPEGRIVLSNRAAAQISGVEPAYVLIEEYSQNWRLLTPEGEAIPGEGTPLARAVRSGEEFVGQEITLQRPDGRKVPLIFNALPLRDEGKVVGGMVAFWDITEQKEVQRRLEEASRLKDEFLSLASHELKTPVTSIKIYAELAARRPEVVKERFPQLMATLGRQADQLVSLVNDLLDVSRLQMGRMPLNRQRLDLAALVDEICQRSRPMFEGRPLACNLGRESVLVEADPLRLEQVFQNLLDNAAKYSPEGGAIEVRVGRREDKALVEVVDRGIGISPEVLPHVFERFYKPRAQQAVYGGLGLGLYICKELVERHGGRIWAESTPGQGSTFYVELPLVEEA